MSRQVVLGYRNDGSYGLFVAPAGYDAYDAGIDSLLLFSSNRRHAMLVDSGSVTLAANNGTGIRQNFSKPVSSIPLVFCGRLWERPSSAPVFVIVDTSGFYAYPQALPDGSFPAGNATVSWYAWLKNQG